MSFLKLEDKCFLITGVANKKSVAFSSAKILLDEGAKLIFTAQNNEIKEKIKTLFPESPVYLLDVKNELDYNNLYLELSKKNILLDGVLHSIAFANYSEGIKPFHETLLKDYLEATTISQFSLISLAKYLLPILSPTASLVTVSISSTRATNYGYMGPIKASLDATVAFLAKSLSEKSVGMRVNAVCAGPLKTSASAGIPGYIENYLFAEQLTMRHSALKTEEVASSITFLLSPASSGINASGIVVDAGMSANYFDQKVVEAFSKI